MLLAQEAIAEVERLRAALDAIAGFGDVNLAGEWEPSLRDIIRSMTDCAKRALRESKCAEIERTVGPEGLADRQAPGHPGKLNTAQREALAAMVESGPMPAIHGVVRWRLKDLALRVWEEFRVAVSETTLSRIQVEEAVR